LTVCADDAIVIEKDNNTADHVRLDERVSGEICSTTVAAVAQRNLLDCIRAGVCRVTALLRCDECWLLVSASGGHPSGLFEPSDDTKSWAAGLATYLAVLRAFWRQAMGSGDLRDVMVWSALATAVATATAYAPTMFALRYWLRYRPGVGSVVFPIVGIALGVLPVLFIVGLWSHNIGHALLSPEAALFYCMFAAFAARFGSGFFLIYGRSSV
jgi:hypothetical protein